MTEQMDSDLEQIEIMQRAYRNYLQVARNWCVVLLSVMLFAIVIGVPHVQTTYTYVGERPRGGSPTAQQKISAWYFSVTGWQFVEAGQFGQQGCPPLLFVPLSDCIDWDDVQSKLSLPSTKQGVSP